MPVPHRASGKSIEWPPKPPKCDRCKVNGHDVTAYIQLVGEWLCKGHYEYAIENESAHVKMRVRQAPVRR